MKNSLGSGYYRVTTTNQNGSGGRSSAAFGVLEAVAFALGLQTGSIIMFLGVAALLVGCAIGAGAIRLEAVC